MRILIAEDDPDIADLVAHYLHKSGWETHIAPSGDKALAYARAHPVDLVILDLMLPGMDGLDICRALRADQRRRAFRSSCSPRGATKPTESPAWRSAQTTTCPSRSAPTSWSREFARSCADRSARRPQEKTLRFGPLVVDLVSHTVSYDGT